MEERRLADTEQLLDELFRYSDYIRRELTVEDETGRRWRFHVLDEFFCEGKRCLALNDLDKGREELVTIVVNNRDGTYSAPASETVGRHAFQHFCRRQEEREKLRKTD